MDLELIKKLQTFYLNGNLGLGFDVIDYYENYTIAYNHTIKDPWWNFISTIKAKDKKEFDKIILEAGEKLKEKGKEVVIAVLPNMENIYSQKEMFFEKESYELLSEEVWQVFEGFEKIDKMNTNCSLKVVLEKTTDMKQYGEEMLKAYQTGNKEDPYGELDISYKESYMNYEKVDNEYINEFFFIKVNDEIVGITQGLNDKEIYGIYNLAIKESFRGKGIGKEVIKQQLQMCKNKNLKLAFLQTEEGYYPADIYRRLGFKDACLAYYYKKV